MTLLDLTPPRQLASRLQGLPVAIIGAGPIGLAAAANLAERGIDFVRARGGRPRRRERRAVGAHPAVLAVEAPRRPGLAAPARRDGLDRAAGRLRCRPAPSSSRRFLRPARRAARDRFAHPARRRRHRRHPRGHGPHAHHRARTDAVPAADAHRRRRRGAHRPRGDRRLGHVPHPEPPRLLGARPARAARGRRPRQPRAARRARPRARRVRRPAHRGRGRRPLGREHAAQPRGPRRAGARHPHHLGHPQRHRGTRLDVARRRAAGARVDRRTGRRARRGRVASTLVDRFEIVRLARADGDDGVAASFASPAAAATGSRRSTPIAS